MIDLAAAYTSYSNELQRFAMSRGLTREDAEDLCNDVFVRAVQAEYTEQGMMRGWLYRILLCRIIDARRRDKRRPVAPLDETLSIDPADDVIISRVLASALLEKLTPNQRRVVELFYFHDLSQEKIAQRMGIAEQSVKNLNYRAHVRLRGCQL